MIFLSRRFDDGSYWLVFETGAVDPFVESTLEAFLNFSRQSTAIARGSKRQWLGLTVADRRQVAFGADFAASKPEMLRYITDWSGDPRVIEPTDIELSLRSMLALGRRRGADASDQATPEYLCRRIIVARDAYGWEFPSNAELGERLELRVDDESHKSFVTWWSDRRRSSR